MKELSLPSGKTAKITSAFKGKHIRKAQAMAGTDTSLLMFAIISQLTIIDGQPVTMEDIDELDGSDVLTLMGEFGENFTSLAKN